jgi:hypothetical protein
MTARENLAHFAHEGVRISALVPATWSVSEVAENRVRFYAPAHPEHDDHSPTFSISLGEPEGFGPDGFQDFCDASRANLAQGLGFAQLQALGLMDRYNLYLINAASLPSLAEVYLPVFSDILRSLRMLPGYRDDAEAGGVLDQGLVSPAPQFRSRSCGNPGKQRGQGVLHPEHKGLRALRFLQRDVSADVKGDGSSWQSAPERGANGLYVLIGRTSTGPIRSI